MGMVYTEITIRNLSDDTLARSGYIKSDDIRTETVTALADTGSMYLVITEELRLKLGLNIVGEKTANIANGQQLTAYMTDAVEIHWKNRFTVGHAMVIPGAQKILFGAIPMEAMDLMVNPVKQEVTGAHGDKEEHLVLFYEVFGGLGTAKS